MNRKRLVLSIAAAVTVIIGGLMVAIALVISHAEPARPRRPERPAGVPPDAVWAGGVDGGDFFRCRPERTRYRCAVYDDHTGDLLAEGAFVLEDEPGGVSKAALQFDSFDGYTIYLRGNRILAPVKGQVKYPFDD